MKHQIPEIATVSKAHLEIQGQDLEEQSLSAASSLRQGLQAQDQNRTLQKLGTVQEMFLLWVISLHLPMVNTNFKRKSMYPPGTRQNFFTVPTVPRTEQFYCPYGHSAAN